MRHKVALAVVITNETHVSVGCQSCVTFFALSKGLLLQMRGGSPTTIYASPTSSSRGSFLESPDSEQELEPEVPMRWLNSCVQAALFRAGGRIIEFMPALNRQRVALANNQIELAHLARAFLSLRCAFKIGTLLRVHSSLLSSSTHVSPHTSISKSCDEHQALISRTPESCLLAPLLYSGKLISRLYHELLL